MIWTDKSEDPLTDWTGWHNGKRVDVTLGGQWDNRAEKWNNVTWSCYYNNFPIQRGLLSRREAEQVLLAYIG